MSRFEAAKTTCIRSAGHSDEGGNQNKSKTKNKPKDEKKINQTKNKGKKEWKQR